MNLHAIEPTRSRGTSRRWRGASKNLISTQRADQQNTPRSWTQHVASYWASGPSIDARSKALRLSAERFVWAHALTAFDDQKRTPDARLKGLRNLSSVVRGCCASEPSEVPPWSSRSTTVETSEEVVAGAGSLASYQGSLS